MVKLQGLLGYIYIPLFKFALFIIAPLYITFSPRSKAKVTELLTLSLYYIWLFYYMSFLPTWNLRIYYFILTNVLTSVVFLQIVLAHLAMPTDPMTEEEEFVKH